MRIHLDLQINVSQCAQLVSGLDVTWALMF